MIKAIETLEDLKQLCEKDYFDCAIMLNHGLRSSKRIFYDKQAGTWSIYNEIDDSFDEFSDDKDFRIKYPLFFEAIKNKSLIYYE